MELERERAREGGRERQGRTFGFTVHYGVRLGQVIDIPQNGTSLSF